MAWRARFTVNGALMPSPHALCKWWDADDVGSKIRGGSIMTSSVVVPARAGAGTRQPSRSAEVIADHIGGTGHVSGGRIARAVRWAEATEVAVCGALRPYTLPALRLLLGVLFIWFGALKVSGTSPVGAMVSGTLPWLSPNVAVVGLGSVEILLGAALVTGVGLRVVLPVLVAHLAGTFLTFVMLPGLMVNGHNPLLLTEPGEFVVKNLVLICAALVLMTHTRQRTRTVVQL